MRGRKAENLKVRDSLLLG